MAAASEEAAVPSSEWRRAEDLPLLHRAGAFAFLLSLYFCYAWSWNTVDILRPYIAARLNLSLVETGFIYSVQAAGALFGAIINGQLADRFGRRNMLVIAVAGFGLLLAASGVTDNYALLLVERGLLGFFMGAMYPITVGLYVTLFAPHIRGRLSALALGIYNVAVGCLGAVGAFVLDHDWRVLLYVGLIPAALAPFAYLVMPDDKRLIPHSVTEPPKPVTKLPILELFEPGVRMQTLLLVTMCGLNLFAYQAFTGWVTTYLKDERELAGAAIGAIVSWQFWGACLGCFVWGWLGDRFGRRIGGYGFLIAAGVVIAYLAAPNDVGLLAASGFVYGFAISSSVIWGPWLTELYPSHLRSTAASIFHWGRIFSLFAPLITGLVAAQFGLLVGMGLATICFLVAAVIWFVLPETVKRPAARRQIAAA